MSSRQFGADSSRTATAQDRNADGPADEKHEARLTLLRALDHFWRLIRAKDEEGRRAFDAVAAWFADSDETDPRSFVGVCRRLSLDPARVRADLPPRPEPR
jgi:hypothetical protein